MTLPRRSSRLGSTRSQQAVGLTGAIVAHALLGTLLLQQRIEVTPEPRVLQVQWIEPRAITPPPPPPPPPMAKPTPPAAAPAPRPRPAPRPAEVVREVAEPAPKPVIVQRAAPRHTRGDADEWAVEEGTSDAAPSGPAARRAPSDYAERVKAQVVAGVVRPPGALYPAPRGYKGDMRVLMRQCTIPYAVVVDQDGRIVSYEIDRCNDDLLDAAAEAAIKKAEPFPPPPNGVAQYRIYGSVNFMKPPL